MKLKGAVVVYFKILPRNILEGTEKNHEEADPRYSVFGSRFEPGTSRNEAEMLTTRSQLEGETGRAMRQQPPDLAVYSIRKKTTTLTTETTLIWLPNACWKPVT
jgi:hypothetical protein